MNRLFSFKVMALTLWALPAVVAWLALPHVGESRAAEPSPVVVKLLEAGQEPRRLLRFQVRPSQKEKLVMTIDMAMSMEIGGRKMAGPPLPKQECRMELEVTSVNAGGDLTYRYVITKFDVVDDPQNPSPAAGQIRGMLKSVEGATGTAVLTNRAITKKNEFHLPPGVAGAISQMMEGMKNSMQSLSAPLPAEPVGAGAKWEVVQQLDPNGIELTQTSVHEVLEMNGDRIKLQIGTTQRAEPQEVSPPGAAGAKLKLNRLSTTGEGDSLIDLRQLVPIAANSFVNSKTEMVVNAGQQEQLIKTEVKMTTKIHQE